MTLTQNEINSYKENGFLIIENLFSKEEIEALAQETSIFNDLKDLPNVIMEEDGGAVRSVFAPNTMSKKYNELYQQNRLVKPAQQLLESDIYLYQFKLNNKKAFVGDWWEWHQDYAYWHLDDGVKHPQMISAMILMQNTTAIQGPLTFIPKSHQNGMVEFQPKQHLKDGTDLKNSLSADLKYTINRNLVTESIKENGFIEATGSIGTCVFFHPNLFHASNTNISPFERNTAIVTYNDVKNLPEDNDKNRPEYVCARDFRPIDALKINFA
ncbi:MAG: ectoine hydroxylase [Crocinitomix sp.]|jgi:ectoine hydroxylase